MVCILKKNEIESVYPVHFSLECGTAWLFNQQSCKSLLEIKSLRCYSCVLEHSSKFLDALNRSLAGH